MARDKIQLSQSELARRLDVSPQTVQQWESGDTGPKRARLDSVASVLGTTPAWLQFGDEVNEPPRLHDSPAMRHVGMHAGRKIPVLSYAQAGNPIDSIAAWKSGPGRDFLILDDELSNEVGASTFTLIIVCDSMSPDFRPEDRVVVDPDIKPRPGDFVVAKIANELDVIFRRYRSRGNDADGREVFELAPINQDYATIVVDATCPGEIIGTMIEHRQRRRK